MNLDKFLANVDTIYYGEIFTDSILSDIQRYAKETYPEVAEVEVTITEEGGIKVNLLFLEEKDQAWFLLKWR